MISQLTKEGKNNHTHNHPEVFNRRGLEYRGFLSTTPLQVVRIVDKVVIEETIGFLFDWYDGWWVGFRNRYGVVRRI
tara:strand:- start:560 stop:790 length:231 start_codon:yes stop_codon:yes gene_type:complete